MCERENSRDKKRTKVQERTEVKMYRKPNNETAEKWRNDVTTPDGKESQPWQKVESTRFG